MTGFEWFLLVVVVIVVPLVVAVAVTLWTLEMARQRKRQNRTAVDPAGGPVKRNATRPATMAPEGNSESAISNESDAVSPETDPASVQTGAPASSASDDSEHAASAPSTQSPTSR
jgi:cytoskeletal protein RodZ